MIDIAVRVENLSKSYRIGGPRAPYKTLRDSLVSAAIAPVRRLREPSPPRGDEIIWALKELSFEVKRGEAIGIVGRNGAGKSTLLKILSRITRPTKGRAEIHGRVGRLLEVGTGFHPELTGRENIYLNGAILGMRKAEINRKFDEIVAFSEIERFLDTPVKHYSSGMYMRLAFAVAAHLDPEILLVDEVLAVGDAAFQKKCLGKMGDVAKEGRTVLFVSHNMTAIKSLCSKAIFLSDGGIAGLGPVQQVVNRYLSSAWQARAEQTWDSMDLAPGNKELKVRHISVAPVPAIPAVEISVETPLRVKFQFWMFNAATINLSMHMKRISGEIIFAVASPKVDIEPGLATFACDIPGQFMNDGVYTIEMMVVKDSRAIFAMDEGVVFEIRDIARNGNWWGKWPGAVRPKFQWDYSLVPMARSDNGFS